MNRRTCSIQTIQLFPFFIEATQMRPSHVHNIWPRAEVEPGPGPENIIQTFLTVLVEQRLDSVVCFMCLKKDGSCLLNIVVQYFCQSAHALCDIIVWVELIQLEIEFVSINRKDSADLTQAQLWWTLTHEYTASTNNKPAWRSWALSPVLLQLSLNPAETWFTVRDQHWVAPAEKVPT